MTSNPIVRKLGFTGSTEVGKLLMAQCAGQVKKVSLELGGNAPFLVFDDCDLDAAIAGAMMCKFRNSGQTCITANRMYVQDSIHDEFVERFAAAISQLAVGAGTSGGVDVGPLIDGDALAKVERHVIDAREQGAELLIGGARHELGGTFFQPTLLTGIRSGMAMTIEETFGPVAGITRFSDEREGIDLANNTPYGLAAFFYSRDIGRIWRVSEGLETGIVGINTGFISNEVVAVRRRQGVGHRARGLEVRARGVAGSQVPLHGRHLTVSGPRRGGHVLVDGLRAQGVELVFGVPGESYLAVLDALYDARDAIRFVSARQEGAASMMAEAYGKLTGRPGVCLVTRGPGTTNGSSGLHVAFQDSTPLVMLIGQVGRGMLDREAFQEVDYRRFLPQLCKWVAQVDRAERLPELLQQAFWTARSGRPGSRCARAARGHAHGRRDGRRRTARGVGAGPSRCASSSRRCAHCSRTPGGRSRSSAAGRGRRRRRPTSAPSPRRTTCR